MEIVSFEIAKKLKEKGFPQHITDEAYIIENYGEDEYDIGDRLPIPLIPDYMDDVAAPTISQVLKWLRESKKMFVQIEINGMGYIVSIYRRKYFDSELIYPLKNKFDTYEHAALAGIEYCLDNLI